MSPFLLINEVPSIKFLVLTRPNEDGSEGAERATKYLTDMVKVPKDPSNLSLDAVAATV